jgi:hypothetical protein
MNAVAHLLQEDEDTIEEVVRGLSEIIQQQKEEIASLEKERNYYKFLWTRKGEVPDEI